MKKLLLFAAIAAFASCSHDNCEEKKADIYAKYEKQLEFYPDDAARRELIREQRDRELANAC